MVKKVYMRSIIEAIEIKNVVFMVIILDEFDKYIEMTLIK